METKKIDLKQFDVCCLASEASSATIDPGTLTKVDLDPTLISSLSFSPEDVITGGCVSQSPLSV